MQPTTTTGSTDDRSAPLPTPALAEATRNLLAQQLENYLTPLLDYCDQQEADENLTLPDFQHVRHLREFLEALGRYDEASEALVGRYRQALADARPVPSLEEAILGQFTPAELLAHREADPVYRLGFVRGHRKGTAQTEARYEHLTSLYAQYAILVPPPGYTPSPLVQRVNRFLDTPAMQAYAALPLETRQALNNLTPADLQAHVEPR